MLLLSKVQALVATSRSSFALLAGMSGIRDFVFRTRRLFMAGRQRGPVAWS